MRPVCWPVSYEHIPPMWRRHSPPPFRTRLPRPLLPSSRSSSIQMPFGEMAPSKNCTTTCNAVKKKGRLTRTLLSLVCPHQIVSIRPTAPCHIANSSPFRPSGYHGRVLENRGRKRAPMTKADRLRMLACLLGFTMPFFFPFSFADRLDGHTWLLLIPRCKPSICCPEKRHALLLHPPLLLCRSISSCSTPYGAVVYTCIAFFGAKEAYPLAKRQSRKP